MATIAEALALATQQYQTGAGPQAEATCRQILQADPFHAEALHLLGLLALQAGKPNLAAPWIEKSIAMSPGRAAYHSNLALAYQGQGRLTQAVACCRHSLVLEPASAMTLNNLGNLLRELGQVEESTACYERAVQLRPDFPEAHLNRARNWLVQGNFEQGLQELEWRWKQRDTPPLTYTQPLWDGSPLGGRTLLLHTEGGMGDVLQLIRYAPVVKQRGGRVLVNCQPRLLPLLGRCPGIDQLVARESPQPPSDTYAPLLSLPRICGTTLATIPADVPYLFADEGLTEHWRRQLRGDGGFKIGIAWQGDPQHEKLLERSVPLKQFGVLARLPGVRLYSLQKGPGSEQVREVAGQFPLVDLASRLDETAAFLDTAAVMKNLDLVVTSDTSIPHLAGALGVPVWVALRFAAEWRWLLHREDCPWYPTMRLFRQAEPGNWTEVFQRIAGAVKEKLA